MCLPLLVAAVDSCLFCGLPFSFWFANCFVPLFCLPSVFVSPNFFVFQSKPSVRFTMGDLQHVISSRLSSICSYCSTTLLPFVWRTLSRMCVCFVFLFFGAHISQEIPINHAHQYDTLFAERLSPICSYRTCLLAYNASYFTVMLDLYPACLLLLLVVVRWFSFRKKIQPMMCAVKMGGDQTALTGTVTGHLYSWNVGAPSSDIGSCFVF